MSEPTTDEIAYRVNDLARSRGSYGARSKSDRAIQ